MEPQAVIDIFRATVTGHYFDFEGRTRRQDFWFYVLAYVCIYIVLAVVQSILHTRLLTSLLSLGLLLPSLGIAVRRLHDIDRSGWWILIGVVPGFVAGVLSVFALMTVGLGGGMLLLPIMSVFSIGALAAAVLLIYWYAQPGTVGSNRFGAEPSAGTTPAAS